MAVNLIQKGYSITLSSSKNDKIYIKKLRGIYLLYSFVIEVSLRKLDPYSEELNGPDHFSMKDWINVHKFLVYYRIVSLLEEPKVSEIKISFPHWTY